MWEFWLSVPVPGRYAPVLMRRGLGAEKYNLLTAEGVSEWVALSHALFQLLQKQCPIVEWKGGDEGKDGVLGAPVITALNQGQRCGPACQRFRDVLITERRWVKHGQQRVVQVWRRPRTVW